MLARVVRELSRRRVFRGAGTYVIVAWMVLQFVNAQTESYDPLRRLALIWAIGLFPLAVVFSWVFRVIPGVVEREHHGEAPPPRTMHGRAMDLGVFAGLVVIAIVEVVRRFSGG